MAAERHAWPNLPLSQLPTGAAPPRIRAADVDVALTLQPRFLAPALALCDDPSPSTRAAAATLAAALGGPGVADTLTGLLDDPEPAVRAAAARGLGRLEDARASARLAELLGDPVWSVRQAAALGLRSLRGPGVLLLRRSLASDSELARSMARQALDLPDGARVAARR